MRPLSLSTFSLQSLSFSIYFLSCSARGPADVSAPAVGLHRVDAERARVPAAAPGHHAQDGPQKVQRHHVQQDPREDLR